MFLQTLGGAIDGREQRADYLADPFLVSMALLAGRTVWLRAAATTCCSGSSPRSRSSSHFNASHYDVVGDGRYISPALPLLYTSIGLAVDAATAWRRRRAGVGGWW